MKNYNLFKLFFLLVALAVLPQSVVAKSAPAEDFAKAGKFFENGKYAKAATYYKRAVASDPKNAEYHMRLGMSFDALEKFDDAISSYETALKYDYKDKYLVYNNLGVSYGKKKSLSLAIAAFQRSLNLNPKYVGALYNLGMAFFARGDKKNALRQFEKLKALDFDVAQRLMENLNGDARDL